MPEYTLTVKTTVIIEAIDDVHARQEARRKMDFLVTGYMVNNPESKVTLRKLDRIVKLNPPSG